MNLNQSTPWDERRKKHRGRSRRRGSPERSPFGRYRCSTSCKLPVSNLLIAVFWRRWKVCRRLRTTLNHIDVRAPCSSYVDHKRRDVVGSEVAGGRGFETPLCLSQSRVSGKPGGPLARSQLTRGSYELFPACELFLKRGPWLYLNFYRGGERLPARGESDLSEEAAQPARLSELQDEISCCY